MISALVTVALLPWARCLACTKHADLHNNSALATIVSFSGSGEHNPWRHFGLACLARLSHLHLKSADEYSEKGRNSGIGTELTICHYLTLFFFFVLNIFILFWLVFYLFTGNSLFYCRLDMSLEYVAWICRLNIVLGYCRLDIVAWICHLNYFLFLVLLNIRVEKSVIENVTIFSSLPLLCFGQMLLLPIYDHLLQMAAS